MQIMHNLYKCSVLFWGAVMGHHVIIAPNKKVRVRGSIGARKSRFDK